MLSHITSRTYHLDDVTRVYRQLHRSLASDGHIFDRFEMDVKPEHMNLIHVLLILFNFSYHVLLQAPTTSRKAQQSFITVYLHQLVTFFGTPCM